MPGSVKLKRKGVSIGCRAENKGQVSESLAILPFELGELLPLSERRSGENGRFQ